ncbi:MAG: hypothetical protein ABW020_10470, partial [Candidatus Rokuibacteriota bacterium]
AGARVAVKPRGPAVARAVIALALLGASGAGASEVRNHEAPGNLESTHDLGCVGAARLSSAHMPPDLYRALEKCVQRETYDDATLLFALAGPATTTQDDHPKPGGRPWRNACPCSKWESCWPGSRI